MQQTFDVSFLAQVFNPLYALPIIAVILCAFLVYAFGFKKPVQPPSFDELLEVGKKPTKKRKVKDSQKGKQQNGKIPSHVTKTSENGGMSGKKKHEKPLVKSDEKNVSKKITVVEKKKKQNPNQPPIPIVEDTDEGWVHHVSKKGRKNKKKDDAVQQFEVSETFIQNGILAVEKLDNMNKRLNVVEEKIINGSNDIIEIDENEVIVEKSTTVVKPLAKQHANKKQPAKSKIDCTTDSGKVSTYTKVDDHISKNGLTSPTIESESSELESSIASDLTKMVKAQQKQSKKKKKKKQDEEKSADDALLGVPTVEESLPNFPSSKCVVSSELSVISSHEVADNVYQTSELGANVGLILDEHKGVENCEEREIGTKGSNVAFDELEGGFGHLFTLSARSDEGNMAGLCLDAKVTKKKRRVRRDH